MMSRLVTPLRAVRRVGRRVAPTGRSEWKLPVDLSLEALIARRGRPIVRRSTKYIALGVAAIHDGWPVILLVAAHGPTHGECMPARAQRCGTTPSASRRAARGSQTRPVPLGRLNKQSIGDQ
jgi:hypothetical protein